MSFVDKSLTCRDCNQEFVFTIGEQEFYAEKGFTQNEPSRCPTCRRANKARRQSEGGNGYGGGFGGQRQDRQMFDATCSDCGRATQVPFQPKSDRPVYCNDCFQAHRPPRQYDRF